MACIRSIIHLQQHFTQIISCLSSYNYFSHPNAYGHSTRLWVDVDVYYIKKKLDNLKGNSSGNIYLD